MHKKLRPLGCNVELFPKKGPTTTFTSNILSLCVYSLTFTHLYRCKATIKKIHSVIFGAQTFYLNKTTKKTTQKYTLKCRTLSHLKHKHTHKHGHVDLSVALQTIVEMIFPEILIFWTIEIVDSTCKNVKYLCISFSRQRWRCVLLQIHALGPQSNSFRILLLSISWIKCLFFFLLVIFM